MKLFKYIEPMWLGHDREISVRRVLAIALSIDLIMNINYVIHHWEIGKSVADAAMLVGIEAGLITALLALTTYTNAVQTKIDDRPNNNIQD